MLPFLTPFGLPYSVPTGLVGGLWLSWRLSRASSRGALQREVALGGALLGVIALRILVSLAPTQWLFEPGRVVYFAAVGAGAAWLAPIVVDRLALGKDAA